MGGVEHRLGHGRVGWRTSRSSRLAADFADVGGLPGGIGKVIVFVGDVPVVREPEAEPEGADGGGRVGPCNSAASRLVTQDTISLLIQME